MTTRHKGIGDLLREKRKADGSTKAATYRWFGVSPQTYDSWESGMYVPGAEHGEKLAEWLNMDEREIAWLLYVESANRVKGLYRKRLEAMLRNPMPDLMAS